MAKMNPDKLLDLFTKLVDVDDSPLDTQGTRTDIVTVDLHSNVSKLTAVLRLLRTMSRTPKEALVIASIVQGMLLPAAVNEADLLAVANASDTGGPVPSNVLRSVAESLLGDMTAFINDSMKEIDGAKRPTTKLTKDTKVTLSTEDEALMHAAMNGKVGNA